MSLKTKDQSFLTETEQDAALEYAKIALDYGIKVSLFISGKAVIEQPDKIKTLYKMDNVELGGHNFYCFKPKYFYALCRRLLNLANGPEFFQSWEILKTKKTLRKLLGIDINSWRNHGYRRDKNTNRLLAKCGIQVVSDEVGPKYEGAYLVYPNLWSLPVNVMPDHDHLIHNGTIGTHSAGKRSLFNRELYSVNDWYEIIKNQTKVLLNLGHIAVLLVHPCCMKVSDNFQTFKTYCKFISKFESYFVSEIVQKSV